MSSRPLGTFVSWQFENVLAAIQVPFPVLTDLRLFSEDETLPVILDSPLVDLPQVCETSCRLAYYIRTFVCYSPALYGIPHSRHVSPELMVTLLSVFSSLRELSLEFQSRQSRPDWQSRSSPPPKRSILHALNKFLFKGVTEYLEELVTRIDTPQLYASQPNRF